MATLSDVFKFRGSIQTRIDLFGASAKFLQELRERVADIGDSLMKELGVQSRDEAMRLPAETNLTPNAERKFEELKNWYLGQTKPTK